MFAQISVSIIEHFAFCELHILVLFALWNMGKSADTRARKGGTVGAVLKWAQ